MLHDQLAFPPAAATEHGADEHHDDHFELAVEDENIETGAIFRIFGVVVAFVIVLAVIGVQLAKMTTITMRAEATQVSGHPELREVRATAAQQLSQYGVVDAEAGVYRIPIDTAIDLIVNESMQSTPETGSDTFVLMP